MVGVKEDVTSTLAAMSLQIHLVLQISGNVSSLSKGLRIMSSSPSPQGARRSPSLRAEAGRHWYPRYTTSSVPEALGGSFGQGELAQPVGGGGGERERGIWGHGHICEGGLEMGEPFSESSVWGLRPQPVQLLPQWGLRRWATSHRNLSFGSVRSYKSHERPPQVA